MFFVCAQFWKTKKWRLFQCKVSRIYSFLRFRLVFSHLENKVRIAPFNQALAPFSILKENRLWVLWATSIHKSPSTLSILHVWIDFLESVVVVHISLKYFFGQNYHFVLCMVSSFLKCVMCNWTYTVIKFQRLFTRLLSNNTWLYAKLVVCH